MNKLRHFQFYNGWVARPTFWNLNCATEGGAEGCYGLGVGLAIKRSRVQLPVEMRAA